MRAWPQPHVDFLATTWREGWSFSELAGFLAEQFGIRYTRSAIAGKIGRMALKNAARVKRAPKPRAKRKPVALSAAVTQPAREDPPVRCEPRVWLDIYQLGKDTCRFPFGDRPPFDYCGAMPVEGSHYCPKHTRLCLNYPVSPPTPPEGT